MAKKRYTLKPNALITTMALIPFLMQITICTQNRTLSWTVFAQVLTACAICPYTHCVSCAIMPPSGIYQVFRMIWRQNWSNDAHLRDKEGLQHHPLQTPMLFGGGREKNVFKTSSVLVRPPTCGLCQISWGKNMERTQDVKTREQLQRPKCKIIQELWWCREHRLKNGTSIADGSRPREPWCTNQWLLRWRESECKKKSYMACLSGGTMGTSPGRASNLGRGNEEPLSREHPLGTNSWNLNVGDLSHGSSMNKTWTIAHLLFAHKISQMNFGGPKSTFDFSCASQSWHLFH